LYPVHLFTLIVSALLLVGVKVSGVATVKDFSTWTPANFVANTFLAHAWRPYAVESWNNASWSVSCEWFAYLMFPLLVLSGRKKLSLQVAVLCAAILPAIPAVFVQVAHFPPFFLLVKVMCEFTAGCCIFRLYSGWREDARFRMLFPCGVGLALISALILIWRVRHIAPDWLALFFPFLILAVAESSGQFERLLGSKIAVYWGRVSYSLYMTHSVTLWILKARLPVPKNGASPMVFSVYCATISVVAVLTYHFVEEPCRTWMRGQGHRKFAGNTGAIQAEGDIVPRATSN
jgi:peptidoglycan/LPS O-acetylase OafA/YrhL